MHCNADKIGFDTSLLYRYHQPFKALFFDQNPLLPPKDLRLGLSHQPQAPRILGHHIWDPWKIDSTTPSKVLGIWETWYQRSKYPRIPRSQDHRSGDLWSRTKRPQDHKIFLCSSLVGHLESPDLDMITRIWKPNVEYHVTRHSIAVLIWTLNWKF